MKTIRFLALGTALAIGMGSAIELQAQAAPAPQAGSENGTKERGERGSQGRATGVLFRDIELTDSQKTQVKAIHDRYRSQMQALRPEGPRGRGDSATRPDSATIAQARTLMASRHADLRAVLTPEQQVAFDRNVAQVRERGERRAKEAGARKGGKGARRGRASAQ